MSQAKDVTFLDKSFGEWSEVENPVIFFMNYDGSKDSDEVKMVATYNENNNNYYDVASNSKHDEESNTDNNM